MKIMAVLLLFTTLIGNVFSQNHNRHLAEMLDQMKISFTDYSKRTPSEIYDGRYDETDLLLLMRIGLIDGYDIIFSKDEISAFKTDLVVEISKIFDEKQLEAIVKMSNESDVDKKKAGKYLEAARLDKTGKIKENKIIKKI